MLFAFIYTDKPDSSDVRAQSRPAHLEYMSGFSDRVLVAGPTLSNDLNAMTGSLLIVDFEDLSTARAFADNDPYNQAGLFESVVVRPWKQVLPKD